METLYGQNAPYCGFPPSPENLLLRWNLDPFLILALTLALVVYFAAAGRTERKNSLNGRQTGQGWFLAGWLIATLALISPICALSVSLFSARIAQHMILELAAAPLVAMGLAPLLKHRAKRGGALITSSLAYLAALWFWHTPAPYQWTFDSDIAYWAMHLTTFFSALWLWGALIVSERARAMAVAAASLFASVQMGLLGAIITLAQAPMYAAHFTTAQAWGLSPLADQQLGGAIMWIPGCLVFLVVSIVSLKTVLDHEPAKPVSMGRGA